ncbi:MAG: dicarboxylate/amino acid:cation symporter [Enterocloster bolteae]
MLKKYNKMNDIPVLIAIALGSLLGILLGEKATCIGFYWNNLAESDENVPCSHCHLHDGKGDYQYMDNPKTLGRIGIRIVVFYMFTTVAASVLRLVITGVFHPGVGFQFTEGSAEAVEIAELPTVGKFFWNMFSSNIFATFNNANMMQVLIIAVIMGVAIVMLPEEKRTPVRNWFVSMADLVMSIISIALKLAPIGVFCLMANALGKYSINHSFAHHVQAFRYLLFVAHPSSDSGILFDFMAVYWHYPL